ncbi:MAG TPA: AI-2E family transporter [Anaerolineae bacterium]|nr:AI-2E family transporter [Anaerolineae bacterium]
MTSATSPPFVRRDAREIVVATLVVAAVLGGFFLLYRFRVVVFLLLAAFVINVAITPAVNWLVSKGRSRPLAVALVYLALLVAVSLLVILVGPMLVNQVNNFAARIPEFYRSGRELLIASPNYVLRRVALIAPVLPDMAASVETDAAALVEVVGFLTGVSTALRALLIAGTIFALAYYWNLESQRVKLWLLRFAPAQRRERIRAVVDEVEATVGAFLAGQLLLGLLIGVASLGAYLLIGLPYAVALAVLAGLFELIPLVGPVLGAAAALVVALVYDPSKAIWVVVAAVVIQALENYILVPRVVGQSVGVNPLVTLLALLAFGSLFGIPGALVAIPLAAIVQIAFHSIVFNLDKQGWEAMSARDRLALLRYEAHTLIYDIRKTLRRKQGLSTDEYDRVEETVEALAQDVDHMLQQQEQERGALS